MHVPIVHVHVPGACCLRCLRVMPVCLCVYWILDLGASPSRTRNLGGVRLYLHDTLHILLRYVKHGHRGQSESSSTIQTRTAQR